jgi:prepilin-type processing-associated H-X9-DG protein
MEHPSGRTWLPAISESQVKAPSEMFAISDSRVGRPDASGSFSGADFMVFGLPQRPQDEIKTPRHANRYNVLACDGHVVVVARNVLLDPRKSGQNWNNDHQPHPELWSSLFWY